MYYNSICRRPLLGVEKRNNQLLGRTENILVLSIKVKKKIIKIPYNNTST